MKIKCGIVALVGRPNAGKSSLINAIIEEKVSIVSPKPQTTRNNILGIYNSSNSQIVFVDTPGINKTDSRLGDYMQRSVKGAISDINVLCLVHDITQALDKKERGLIQEFSSKNIPVILVLTKADLVTKEQIANKIFELSDLSKTCEIIPLSSLKHKNIEELISLIEAFLPEVGEENRLFDDESYTDKPLKFIVSEIIREKALYLLRDEIPHGIAVIVENYKEEENIVNIDAVIICEKQNHKGIILGKNGEMLKKIGHNARVTIQKVVQKKVVLNIFVKVKTNWKNNMDILSSLGYNINEV